MKEISTPLLFRKSFLNLNLASSGRIVGEKRNKKNRCKNIFLAVPKFAIRDKFYFPQHPLLL